MRTKLAVHWIPEHVGGEDLDAFRAMQPRSIKIVNPDANRCRQAFEACPNALFVYRSHSLSEQKAEMQADPAGTGRRHARELSEQVAVWKPSNLPLEQVMVTGINEPDVNASHPGAIDAVVAYNVAFLDALCGYGMCGGALNLSVGWPDNHSVKDAPPDWAPFEPVRQAILRGSHALVLHEYWPKEGPASGWGWLAGRYTQCPWQVPILIGECGLDHYVVDDTLGGPSGWQHWVSDVAYMAQLAEYDRRICLDSRIHSAQVFTWDYGSNHWEFHNVRNMRDKLVAHHQSANWPEAPIQPQQPAPAPAPVATKLELRYPLSAGKGRLTQVFGVNPDGYKRFGLRGHNGLDWGVDVGTPVLACDAGTVREAQFDADGYGNYIKLVHTWGETVYGHLSYIAVNVGATVRAGDQIGLTGNTGNSTGPHLHLGVRINPYDRNDGWGGFSDPAPYLATAVPVVDVTDSIRDAAWNALGIPRYIKAALYKAAQAAKLGRPVTAEFDWQGYRVQGYDGGIVYCVIGDWGNVRKVDW